MIEPSQICDLLRESSVFEKKSDQDLLPACKKAVRWLKANIKDDADENSQMALSVAAAIARFDIFVDSIGQAESYGSFKIGDVTVKRDLNKEYEIEKELRAQAIYGAAEILKDGGFYFAAN